MENLEDVLNGSDEDETEQVENAEVTPTPEPTGESTETTPVPEDESTTDESWSKAAYMDEKRKRQAYERRIAELEATAQSPAQEKGDFFDDPDEAINQLERSHKSDLSDLRVEMSQEIMRSQHDDYDERELEFVDMAKDNPGLIEQLRGQKNPAKFIYQTVRDKTDLKDLGSARSRIKELEEQLASVNGKSDELNAKRESLTPSLSNQRNVSGGLGNVSNESLEDILGR